MVVGRSSWSTKYWDKHFKCETAWQFEDGHNAVDKELCWRRKLRRTIRRKNKITHDSIIKDRFTTYCAFHNPTCRCNSSVFGQDCRCEFFYQKGISVRCDEMLGSGLPSVTLIGPWRPDPARPDFPSTPSNSTVHVNPGGSEEATSLVIVSFQYWWASCVNSLTCRGHVLNGGRDIIVRTILEYRMQLASESDEKDPWS